MAIVGAKWTRPKVATMRDGCKMNPSQGFSKQNRVAVKEVPKALAAVVWCNTGVGF